MKFSSTLIFLWAIIASFSFTDAIAQKPEKGTFTTEAQLNLFNNFGSPIYSSGLNARYFLNPKWALVLGLEVSSYRNYREVYENQDGSGGKGTIKSSNTNNLFNIGGRYFTKGRENLAPYIGLELGVGNVGYNTETENSNSAIYVVNYNTTNTQEANQMRINLLVGADFWVKGSFYLGVTSGLNYNWNKYKKSVMIINDNGFVTTNRLSPTSNFNISSLVSSGLRIGWRFN